ncbi:MAG TPA: YbhB/YbcL family Raf kinase inhibitor-like protein [Geobacteraceae bacterium]
MKSVLLLILTVGVFAVAADGKEKSTMSELKIASSAFTHDGSIPARFTCDGGDASPPLIVENVPVSARTLALIVDDPDAPAGTWVHWVVWNIPASTREIHENSVPAASSQGKNDWGRNSYGGPCPPSGTHRYFFKLYALDTTLDLGAATTKRGLEKAMAGHILARADLVGTYRRR